MDSISRRSDGGGLQDLEPARSIRIPRLDPPIHPVLERSLVQNHLEIRCLLDYKSKIQ